MAHFYAVLKTLAGRVGELNIPTLLHLRSLALDLIESIDERIGA